ncbi:hypothetical protein K7B09_12735, partial [Thermomonas sp. RSS23]
QPNSSFKPTPLHGIVLSFGVRLLSLRLHLVAARLNSGVRLQCSPLLRRQVIENVAIRRHSAAWARSVRVLYGAIKKIRFPLPLFYLARD